jgi:hypothetical protein
MSRRAGGDATSCHHNATQAPPVTLHYAASAYFAFSAVD